jgi:hypothetical protein
MTISVLVGASVDAFSARSNGDLDWLPGDIRPVHVATRHYPSGLVQSEYPVGG